MARTTPTDLTAERSLDASELSRRSFAATALGGALLAAATPGARAQSSPQPLPRPRMMQQSDVAPLKVAMLVYPRMVMLDLVAPQSVLQMLNSDIHLVGRRENPSQRIWVSRSLRPAPSRSVRATSTCSSCRAG